MMKVPMYRDRNLLDLAKDQDCMLQIPGVCTNRTDTVVAAHSNQAKHGKGKSLKAHDCYSVWACARCHTWLDQSYSAEREEKESAFRTAMTRQIQAWTDVVNDPMQKPWKVKAARLALTWISTHEGRN